jgi:hypothetical protein
MEKVIRQVSLLVHATDNKRHQRTGVQGAVPVLLSVRGYS